MIIRTSMHPKYLSNAYLVADHRDGHAIVIDAGAPIEPLLSEAAELNVQITHLLTTHDHHDHIENADALVAATGAQRIDANELAPDVQLEIGELRVHALATPGHAAEHAAFVVNDEVVFTGDVLFKGTVGGTMGYGPAGYDQLRHSIMDILLALPDETVVYPGHTDPTTIGAEREANPFIRVWRGVDTTSDEPVEVLGDTATLKLWAPDYDGTNKALVELDDGLLAIVGGSRVKRLTSID